MNAQYNNNATELCRFQAMVKTMICLCLMSAGISIPTANAGGPVSGHIQLDTAMANLSSSFSNWHDQTLRLSIQLPSKDHMDAEISHQDHFNDQGTFYGVGYSHIFNDDWYGSLHLGDSSGGFFLPSSRVDAFLNKKWLVDKRLITTIGLGQYNAKDAHVDRNLLLSATYYSTTGLIIEAGTRLNESDPGDVSSSRQFAALTYGKHKQHYLVLRHERGDEAYQLIGPSTLISEFSSHESIISWRQWLSKNYGWNIQTNRYHNPNYDRDGYQAGIFYEF